MVSMTSAALGEQRAWEKTAPYLKALNDKYEAKFNELSQGQTSLNDHTRESRDLVTVKAMLDTQGHTVESSVVLEQLRARQQQLIAMTDPATGAPRYTHEQIFSDGMLEELFLRETPNLHPRNF